MTTTVSENRIAIFVDVLSAKRQKARPLSKLRVELFIKEILHEFASDSALAYLTNNPEHYQLRLKKNDQILDRKGNLPSQGVEIGDELELIEAYDKIPDGTSSIDKPVYIREMQRGITHAIFFTPSWIGRKHYSRRDNSHLAVDLEGCETGQRVSRRHAEITEADGRYLLRQIANNPVFINDKLLGLNEARELHHGDRIYLERSDIQLKFIERDKHDAENDRSENIEDLHVEEDLESVEEVENG